VWLRGGGTLAASISHGIRLERDFGTLVSNNYVFGGYTSTTTACRVGCYPGSSCSPGLDVAFVNNLCVAEANYFPSTQTRTTALDVGQGLASECPLIANNILDANGSVGDATPFSTPTRRQVVAPTEHLQIFNNDIVPRGLACAAYFRMPPIVCHADRPR